jgi:hypothetical protein
MWVSRFDQVGEFRPAEVHALLGEPEQLATGVFSSVLDRRFLASDEEAQARP